MGQVQDMLYLIILGKIFELEMVNLIRKKTTNTLNLPTPGPRDELRDFTKPLLHAGDFEVFEPRLGLIHPGRCIPAGYGPLPVSGQQIQAVVGPVKCGTTGEWSSLLS